MPTYAYVCTSCAEPLEVVQAFADAPLTVCPVCGGKLRKVFSPVGVVFKGSGFYKTDSRTSGSKAGAGASRDSGSRANGNVGAGAGGDAGSGAHERGVGSPADAGTSSGGTSSGGTSSGGTSSDGAGARTGHGSAPIPAGTSPVPGRPGG